MCMQIHSHLEVQLLLWFIPPKGLRVINMVLSVAVYKYKTKYQSSEAVRTVIRRTNVVLMGHCSVVKKGYLKEEDWLCPHSCLASCLTMGPCSLTYSHHKTAY